MYYLIANYDHRKPLFLDVFDCVSNFWGAKRQQTAAVVVLVAVVVSAAVLVAVFKSMKLFALRSVASTSAVCCAEPGTARRITINRFVFS